MFYLGVDGGGTKTTAVLCNAHTHKCLTLKLGPGNVAVLDRGSVAHLIRSVIFGFRDEFEISEIDWGTFAFAGIGRAQEKQTVNDIIEGIGLGRFNLMTDAEALHYATFRDHSGILLSAGTGSICLARTPDGTVRQIGGVGYLVGDEGSGYDIGKMAIRLALNEEQAGRAPGRLTESILFFFGLTDPKNLISVIYSTRNPQSLIASCAQLVIEAAEGGDEDARQIIDAAVDSLISLAERAKSYFPPGETVSIGLAGGALHESTWLHRRFMIRANEKNLDLDYTEQDLAPAAAAVMYAMNEAGAQIEPELMGKLRMLAF